MLDEMGHRPTVISGPVTDNAVGTTYIEGQLHIASRNARLVPEALAVTIGNALGVPLEAGA